ncbi:hypothetical protein VTJ04DRAFT_9725 [Mycothermus thermophilus]|uniref:uncharacterized protein n=1 Tax=Humicola insolens TaxID=85995 RepID=UPI003742E2AC
MNWTRLRWKCDVGGKSLTLRTHFNFQPAKANPGNLDPGDSDDDNDNTGRLPPVEELLFTLHRRRPLRPGAIGLEELK